MTKKDYIIRQLAKTNKKNYENYVVTRIWNKLDNLEIKFITQQYVVRPGNAYALTDMYFPQIGLHVEVDEAHHLVQGEEDRIRQEDIVSITDHEVVRVDVTKDLEEIHEAIDEIVDRINEKIVGMDERFIPWDLDRELDPQTYLEKGYVALEENVAFRRAYEACNCFGLGYKGLQSGGARHPFEEDTWIWFPKLFPNKGWDNRISEDGRIIIERAIDCDESQRHYEKHMGGKERRRLVFAKVKGPLGDILYRFKGVFELDEAESRERRELVWIRTGERARTYWPDSRRI